MHDVLERVAPAAIGLRPDRLEAMCSVIDAHIREGRYPGAQVAVARHGELALVRTFGLGKVSPEPSPARDDTLWHLYSSTKVLVAAGIWLLVEDGLLSFDDPVALHVPEFAANGKGAITLHQVLTHQGGFPSALNPIDPRAWEDHALLRQLVGAITLEWTPGTRVHYHRRSAHWVAAVVIEAVSGMDYRAFLRTRLLEPLGLQRDLFVGLPANENTRTADAHTPSADGLSHARNASENAADYRAAGIPGTGAIGTAAGMAAFYQMMLGGGRLNGATILSRRLIDYVTRNFTSDRIDGHMKMPMHRGLGPHSRGDTEGIRGLGTLAHPSTYGHGGVGTSYCWADPQSGVSFAYLSNSRIPDPWHSRRLDLLSNCVHSAIGDIP